MIKNFLSNKYNLFGIIALSNFLIGYIITPLLSVSQLVVIYLLLLLSNFCVMTYGMAQGMLLVGLAQTAFKEFMDSIEGEDNKNDTE